MEFTSLLAQLPFYANLGSVLGFLITVWAGIAQLKIRRRYLLLLHGADLLETLKEYGSEINRYEDLSQKKRKTVLRGCRSLLRSLSKHVDWSTWRALFSLRWTLWRQWTRATEGEADEIYARVQAVALRDKPPDRFWNRAPGFSDWGQRFGLDESGARTTADAERPKSSVSERAERVSFDDFSGAEAVVSPSHRSRDLFGSFLDPAKNEHYCSSTSIKYFHKLIHLGNDFARRPADNLATSQAVILEANNLIEEQKAKQA